MKSLAWEAIPCVNDALALLSSLLLLCFLLLATLIEITLLAFTYVHF